MSREKLTSSHRERLALISIRQSTPQQVLVHQESTRLQYGLVTRAEALGWPAERVLVIDDDLGKSGTSTLGRAGFQRLVTEVSLGHVGLILGIEMSRLAHSNVDWHQLLQVCALFGTLIADLDGVYDPTHYNDRLLLGLKGTMSEAELHLLKQRLYQGCLSKARRGQLTFALPTGYIWDGERTIQMDPDEQVQQVIRLIFAQFDELGTLGGGLRYCARHDIRIGVRLREGPAVSRGQVTWRHPNRVMLQKYPQASAVCWHLRVRSAARRPTWQAAGAARSARVVVGRADWHAFLPDQCPAYIFWEQYERNTARLQANRARADAMGAVRKGPALLAGLVICVRSGVQMGVHYANAHQRPASHTYECTQQRGTYGGPLCQHLPGPCLDAFVSQQVLVALAPAALELSLATADHVEQERATLLQLWQQRRERTAYEAERAARQYQAVEPENRLVARTLERAWEERLATQQQLEEDYHRFLQHQPRGLRDNEREAIRCLAADIPALWEAATTTAADRKEIVRQVVERVEIAVQGMSEQVHVRICWVGGGHTEGMLLRPIARLADRSDYAMLCERVRTLTQASWSAAAIAQQLDADGYLPSRVGHSWSVASVLTLRRQVGLSGHVQARQEPQGRHRWIIWADAAELERLHENHDRDIADETRQRWRISQPTAEKGERS